MSYSLVAFITARLDEWEGLGQQALPWQTGSRDEGQPAEHVTWRRSAGSVEFGLRHVATLRAIVVSECRAYPPGRLPATVILRLLAADWSTHPAYDKAWALT